MIWNADINDSDIIMWMSRINHNNIECIFKLVLITDELCQPEPIEYISKPIMMAIIITVKADFDVACQCNLRVKSWQKLEVVYEL